MRRSIFCILIFYTCYHSHAVGIQPLNPSDSTKIHLGLSRIYRLVYPDYAPYLFDVRGLGFDSYHLNQYLEQHLISTHLSFGLQRLQINCRNGLLFSKASITAFQQHGYLKPEPYTEKFDISILNYSARLKHSLHQIELGLNLLKQGRMVNFTPLIGMEFALLLDKRKENFTYYRHYYKHVDFPFFGINETTDSTWNLPKEGLIIKKKSSFLYYIGLNVLVHQHKHSQWKFNFSHYLFHYRFLQPKIQIQLIWCRRLFTDNKHKSEQN